MKRSVGFKAIRLIILVLLVTLLSPFIILGVLYELNPYRRNLLYRLECSIISILARQGEISGRALRIQACKEIGRKVSLVTFYQRMSRLVDEKLVTQRTEDGFLEMPNGERYPIKTVYFRLTEGGQRERKHRAATAWEEIKDFPGLLNPNPARSS